MLVYMLDVYCCDLEVVLVWVQVQGVVIEILDSEQLCQFIVVEYCCGLLLILLQCWLLVCCSFYGWLLWYCCIEVSFVVILKVFKVLCKLLQVLDVDEVVCLVELLIDVFFGMCDCVLLELFYFLGLCLSELCVLIWCDLDFVIGLVNVLGKGNCQ